MTTKPKKTPGKMGGARPGAGRPRISDEPPRTYTISLPESLCLRLRKIGPEAVRRTLTEWAATTPDKRKD